eukprot:g23255.t1
MPLPSGLMARHGMWQWLQSLNARRASEGATPRGLSPQDLRAAAVPGHGGSAPSCLGARVHPWPAECTVHALQRSWNALCLTGMGLCTLAEKVLKDFLGEITWA